MDTIEELRTRLREKEEELLNVRLQSIELRIDQIEKRDLDSERRMRLVEASRTRFEVIAWLAFGGGIASVINFITR